jgi:MFS family permease
MAVKRFGAASVMAVAMVGWSAITLGTGFVKNYHQAIAMRLLLGAFEGALFPSLAFVISNVYSREQQAKRIAVLYGASALSGAFGGLIAYAIQLMGEHQGLSAWRWL